MVNKNCLKLTIFYLGLKIKKLKKKKIIFSISISDNDENQFRKY